MPLREILGQVCLDLVIRKLRGATSAAHPVANCQSCHARVLYWVNTKHIRPVELAQYRKCQYWAGSTGSIFSSIDPVEDSGVAAPKIY